MSRFKVFLGTLFLALSSAPLIAETVNQMNGGDTFIAGSSVSETIAAENDVFVAGSTLTLKGSAGGDMHAAGFDVEVETQADGDLYAVGATVKLSADVGEDLSAFGFSVRTAQSNQTAGNVRLFGRTVTIDGPVGGALTATGYEVILNAAVDGDAWIAAEKITYGPNAVIGGQLKYSSQQEIVVPERVIAPDRVSFEKMMPSDAVSAARKSWEHMEYPVMPTFVTMVTGFLISLAFFLVVGAILLTFLPKPVERLRASIWDRPGTIFLIGIIGLSMLFGMVPITALTIVGLPIVPVVLLATILAWTLGYILAAYAVGMRVWQAFGGASEPSKMGRLVALGIAVILIAVLNYIPFLGWIVNYTLVLLGIGAMTNMLFEWIVGTGSVLGSSLQPIDE